MGQRFSWNAVAADHLPPGGLDGGAGDPSSYSSSASSSAAEHPHARTVAEALAASYERGLGAAAPGSAASASASAPASASASPGWEAIHEAVRSVYGSHLPQYHVVTPLALRAAVGGPSPLEGVSVYPNSDHWHLVSFGLSDLHGHGGRDFELTLRVAYPPELLTHARPAASGEPSAKRRRRAQEGQERRGEAEAEADEQSDGGDSYSSSASGDAGARPPPPPSWALRLLDQAARYVHRFKRNLKVGEVFSLAGPHRSGLVSVGLARDPQLQRAALPSGGAVEFIQLVGLHEDETDACFKWDPAAFLEEVRKEDALLVTRLERASWMAAPSFSSRVLARAREQGSTLGEWPYSGRLRLLDGRLHLRLGRTDARRLLAALRARLPHGRPFLLADQPGGGGGGSVLVRPAERPGWAPAPGAAAAAAGVDLDSATAEQVADALDRAVAAPDAQELELEWEALPGVRLTVAPRAAHEVLQASA